MLAAAGYLYNPISDLQLTINIPTYYFSQRFALHVIVGE